MRSARGQWVGSHGAHRGFTLVEVLIALVVLLIGIYAIMAIFPRGYSAMEATQMRTIASQLAESELARWKLSPEALPDQIVATDYNGQLIAGTQVGTREAMAGPNPTDGTVASMLMLWDRGAIPLPLSQQYNNVPPRDEIFYRLDRIPGGLYNPDNLTPCEYDPVSWVLSPGDARRPAARHPNWQPNSLYLPRTIIGEQIDITRLPNRSSVGVPFYLLSHAPLDVLRIEPAASPLSQTKTILMDVYDSRPWQYVPYSAPVNLAARQFTYDPGSKRLYFGLMVNGQPSPGYDYPRSFKLDYTDAYGGRIYGVTVVTGTGGNNNGTSDPLSTPPASPLSLRVYEQLRALTDDEYGLIQYNLANGLPLGWPRNAYYVNAESKVNGKIEFCPDLQTDPLPDDISLIKVDYRVQDWQILVFDVEVPAGGQVQLPINHLKGPGFMNPPRQERPQEVARGVRLFWNTDVDRLVRRSASDPASWAWLVVVDRQNGDILTDTEAQKTGASLSPNAFERRTRVRVDYRNGLVMFNYSKSEVDREAPNTWNPQLDTPDRSGRTYRIFCRGEADWAVQLLPSARIYARSQNLPGGPPVGGSEGALLTYAWSSTRNPAQIFFPLSEAGQAVTVDYYTTAGAFVEGELHTIGGPDVTNLGAWACGLTEPLAQPLNLDIGPVTVRGVSVRARTVWVGRGRRATQDDVARFISLGAAGSPAQSLEEAWYQTFVTTFIPRTPI